MYTTIQKLELIENNSIEFYNEIIKTEEQYKEFVTVSNRLIDNDTYTTKRSNLVTKCALIIMVNNGSI